MIFSPSGATVRKSAAHGMGAAALVAWSLRATPLQAWGASLTAVLAGGLADYVTGPEIWVGPVYLLCICIATWLLGRRQGLLLGAVALCMTLAINGFTAYPLGAVAVAWNMAMRLVALGMMVFLVGAVRRAYEREWQQARRDGLTGLLTRAAFFADAAAAMQKRPAARLLAYVDLDGFKQLNDRLGHIAGDEALCAFAEGMGQALDEGDLLARIGGDEFLIFRTLRSEAETGAAARDLHKMMSEVLSSTVPSVGCSLGAVLLPPHLRRLEDAHVQLADQLMYSAKREAAGVRASPLHGREPDKTGANGGDVVVPLAAERPRKAA